MCAVVASQNLDVPVLENIRKGKKATARALLKLIFEQEFDPFDDTSESTSLVALRMDLDDLARRIHGALVDKTRAELLQIHQRATAIITESMRNTENDNLALEIGDVVVPSPSGETAVVSGVTEPSDDAGGAMQGGGQAPANQGGQGQANP